MQIPPSMGNVMPAMVLPDPALPVATPPAPAGPVAVETSVNLSFSTPQDRSNTPTKADSESVVQANITVKEGDRGPEKEEDKIRAFEKMAEDAARRKTLMGLLPTNPSELSELLSAVATAPTIEALTDIQAYASDDFPRETGREKDT